MKIVYKPWGKEEWLELNQFYCYKRIYINKGYKTSFQYHNLKHETNYIISGSAEVWLENDEGFIEKTVMKEGEYFTVPPPKKHRVIALTDIILQEVSTPHVDDVVRLEDDTLRPNGRIDIEHDTPAVLILAAGKGSRLGKLTNHINKALLPINNKAVISHIIEKFPKEYELIITVGYQKESLQDYCLIAHPDRKFIFVEVKDFDKYNAGYSTIQCEHLLQKPFYLVTVDCLLDSVIPPLDGNWLAVQKTDNSQSFSTVKVENGKIVEMINKCDNGYDYAFTGLAAIFNFKIFWSELKSNMSMSKEVISAWKNPDKYPKQISAKEVIWLDTGSIAGYDDAKKYFKDTSLSIKKNTLEITYRVGNKFIKFSDKLVNKNRHLRSSWLENLAPPNVSATNNFLTYEWVEGKTLYEIDNYSVYDKFLQHLMKTITDSSISYNEKLIKEFYITKTNDRVRQFIKENGNVFSEQSYYINGELYLPFVNLFSRVNFSQFFSNPLYSTFHGDLQFDNIIQTENHQFMYIDWRESFASSFHGDVYYDLAKLYGGCLLPYNLLKGEDFVFSLSNYEVIYSYNISEPLKKFTTYFEDEIIKRGYDLKKIKTLTGLIYLNMSPLHPEKTGHLLWFKGIETLAKCI